MLDTNKKLEKDGPSPVWLILGVAALAAATAAYFLQQQEPAPVEEPVLTEEASSYLSFLPLSPDTAMEAHEDALGQTLLEITGEITNTGDKTCAAVGVNVVFDDINGNEIDRQRSYLVNSRTGPLEPGETQAFRLPFDNVPVAWNQAFPKLFISEIEFAD